MLPHHMLNGISNLVTFIHMMMVKDFNSNQPDDEDAFGYLIRPLPKSMHPMIAIDVAMLLWVKIRWIVKVLPLPLSHGEADKGLSETSSGIALPKK